jgi:hypothetical protein
MPVYTFECRYADESTAVWREHLGGTAAPEAGVELELDGRQWRVVETVPDSDTLKVVLEEVRGND